MAKREIQEINAGSMADIAFLLLIFFLVTTTMDSESGIIRKLPPIPEDQDITDVKVKERNIFVVLVNRDNDLLVEGKQMELWKLKDEAKKFITNEANSEELPEKKEVFIEYFGNVKLTKGHVISLRNDRGTTYETYIAVQNELAAAYNELRNDLARYKWGKAFEDLKEDQQNAIQEYYPMNISEAEPNNVGG